MLIAGHDHLLDHWVEHYTDPSDGKTYRMDAVVTGGGGAPQYSYSSEPDLASYAAANAAQKVRVDHLTHPGPAPENLHHFLVVQVDGSHLSIEVVALGGAPYTPYAGKTRISLDD